MSRKFQLAGCVLALLLGAGLGSPAAFAQHVHTGGGAPPKPANSAPRAAARPTGGPHAGPGANRPGPNPGQNRAQNQRQQHQDRQQERQQFRQAPAPGAQNGRAGRNTAPDWNRPGGGAVHADRPPSANVPPPRYNNLSPQEKQRVFNNYRALQKETPAQRQELQNRVGVWNSLSKQQQDHIRNDVLPKWKQMPPDRRRAIENRLGVLKNMPESARNQHLNDPNFTRGMSDEDKSTLHDLSHLHIGGEPDRPNE
jgi:Protein of unknown function (DUF3106)